jgi:hypothetical protein
MQNDNLKNEIHTDTTNMVAVRTCDGACEIHIGEVIPVIIYGHGWDGIKFNYCQVAIEEDKRRGFVVIHSRKLLEL